MRYALPLALSLLVTPTLRAQAPRLPERFVADLVEADAPLGIRGTLELTPGPAPATWRAAATYQDSQNGETRWRGMARRHW